MSASKRRISVYFRCITSWSTYSCALYPCRKDIRQNLLSFFVRFCRLSQINLQVVFTLRDGQTRSVGLPIESRFLLSRRENSLHKMPLQETRYFHRTFSPTRPSTFTDSLLASHMRHPEASQLWTRFFFADDTALYCLCRCPKYSPTTQLHISANGVWTSTR